MLMPSLASVSNIVAEMPGWLFIPAPMSETLAIRSSARTSPAPISGARSPRDLEARLQVDARDRERDVGRPVDRGVLHDHVDVDRAVGERPEDPRRDAGMVGHAGDRDLRLGVVVGDGGDDGLLHRCVLLGDPGPRLPGEARAHVQRDVVIAGELDRAQHQHAAAARGDLEHLLEADLRQASRLGDDPRVGAEDAGDVGVDLAGVRTERRRERDRGHVGPAASERRDVAVGRHALEARDDRDLAVRERLAQAVGADLEDLRPGVVRVGDDPGLAARERDPLDPAGGERHAEKRHRDPLAGREQHVELPRRLDVAGLVGEPQQIVGRLSHGAHDHDDVVAVALRPGDVVGDGTDPVGVGDRGTPELLDDECHSADATLRARRTTPALDPLRTLQ